MLPVNSPLLQSRRTESARFCFYYRRHRRHARAYEVSIELGDSEDVFRLEIYHANIPSNEQRPFTSGKLNARRLRSAVDLLGLVDRVARKDRSRPIPGSLVFSAHLKSPYVLRAALATHLHADGGEARPTIQPDNNGRTANKPSFRAGSKLNRDIQVFHNLPRARTHHRYPLRHI